MKKLSIVMPAKNAESCIQKTIDSFINQTYSNWELLIVDDHSIDKTANIIKENANNDRRIKYLTLAENTGIPYGRDFGIQSSNGEIIVTADADDIYSLNRLEVTAHCFEKNNIDVFFGAMEVLVVETNERFVRPFQQYDPKLLEMVNIIINTNSAFTRSAYDDCGGYDKNLPICEDYDLWLTMQEKGKRFLGYKEPLALVLRHAQSATSGKKDKLRNYIHKTKIKHGIEPIADLERFKKLVNKDVLDYFTTPGGLFLWFQ